MGLAKEKIISFYNNWSKVGRNQKNIKSIMWGKIWRKQMNAMASIGLPAPDVYGFL